MIDAEPDCPTCGRASDACACGPARLASARMRLLPPASDAACDRRGGGTRLIRELKGPTVEALDGARPVEALPVRAAGDPATSAPVHRGPGFGVRRRDRILYGAALVAAAVAVFVSAWVVLA